MNFFHLDWPVDLDGYRIETEKAPAGRRASVLGDTGPRIVRNGGRLDIRQPLKADGLCRWIAKGEKTPEGALAIVSRFGFLFSAKARSESVAEIYDAIDVAWWLVNMADAKYWHLIEQWLAGVGHDNERFIHGGIGRLGVQFAPGAERPSLRLRPANLFNAALVQLLEEVSIGKPLKPCARPGCPEYFTYGPGTGKRETKEYCSPKCQNAHTYLKRKEARS